MNVTQITIPAVDSDGLDAAYSSLISALIADRPRHLRVTNTRSALEGRLCDIENISMAMRRYLKVLCEDTSTHIPLAGRIDDIVEAAMGDMESDISGAVLKAIERDCP